MAAQDALRFFHPLVRQWFEENHGAPTEVQALTWPKIASGKHVLACAPTGSGKTLAAFLWAIDRLLRRSWSAEKVRVLYVSPLSAKNKDIQKNLKTPLCKLRTLFSQAGEPMVDIRVATRSGDTPQKERRSTLRSSPEILITTPESLNILLTSGAGLRFLSGLQTVILDEVHAVADTKRGTHLITAIERLSRVAGEFQRIALSATAEPLEEIAQWLGGYQLTSRDGAFGHEPREVEIVQTREKKELDLRVKWILPASPPEPGSGSPFWALASREIRARMEKKRSTLVFGNSRRSVLRLAHNINEDAGKQLVYSHHGSLSREIRAVVERRLKQGELAGIAATHSLEMDIDIGTVDEVLLIQTPPSVTSAIQRASRSGHRVSERSQATLYPTHLGDLLHAAVLAGCLRAGELEPVHPPEFPLDVLAQVILSMTTEMAWRADELYHAIRSASPYHHLERRLFDLVVDMLSGRYEGLRLRALQPRLIRDPRAGTLLARPGVARLIYASGGTLPDRGTFELRTSDSRTPLGQLDEEFVWERSVGDRLTLGLQTWTIQRITHNDVLVSPAPGQRAMSPFWRSEQQDSSFWLATRIGRLLEEADHRLEDPTWPAELAERHALDTPAADALVGYLRRQRAATGCALPHRNHLVLERVHDPQGPRTAPLLVLHTFWGGKVNHALALALEAAFAERHGGFLEVTHDDDCLLLAPGFPCDPRDVLGWVSPDEVERLIRKRIESSGLFGVRFCEDAARALILPRAGLRRRTPLWLLRQRGRDLLEATRSLPDFPIRLETFRGCLQATLEVCALKRLLTELRQGSIRMSSARTTSPSPFAADAVFLRTGRLVYDSDGKERAPSQLEDALVQEVTRASKLRPRLDERLVRLFQDKLQRTALDYAPEGSAGLIEWVRERLLIPRDEWNALLEAVSRDHHLQVEEIVAGLGGQVTELSGLVCASEDCARLAKLLGEAASAAPDADAPPLLGSFLRQWLRFYGPVRPGFIGETLGLPEPVVIAVVRRLLAEEAVVLDELTAHAAGLEVCTLENLKRLLRLHRRLGQATLARPHPWESWTLWMAQKHGLGAGLSGIEPLQLALERLFGHPAPAEAWESEILPARLQPYRGTWLDALLAESDLEWVGSGERRLIFQLEEDRGLFEVDDRDALSLDPTYRQIFPAASGRFLLSELVAYSRTPSAELTRRLWRAAWEGKTHNNGFAALRQGVMSGFRPERLPDQPRRDRPRHAGSRPFSRWMSTRPFTGSWSLRPPNQAPRDALERHERDKERVRQLLLRYGVIFRELLLRENQPLCFNELFHALRVMELSGEIVSGRFFEGIAGLQFIARESLAELENLDEDRVYWMNAADPVSPCGLDLGQGILPRRRSTSHLVFHGRHLVVISESSAKRLVIRPTPDHPRLPEYLRFLEVMLSRDFRPRRSIPVHTINDDPAAQSPYREVLAIRFHVLGADDGLILRRKFHK